MTDVQDIELESLRQGEIHLAAQVAARGMRDNPTSVALSGHDPVRRVRDLEPTFEWVLASLKRPSLVARRNGAIVGLAAMAPVEQCFFRQIMANEKTIKLGRMRAQVSVPHVPVRLLLPLLRLGPTKLGRLSAWGEANLDHDPKEPHHHVELVAVDAGLQGLGIGRMMLEELCREMDKSPDVAYLETDKPENLRFYGHFGFQVTAESRVLDTPIWFMERRRT